VKSARGQRGWTQRDLAQSAKVSRGSVQNLENGMKLDEATEAKIEAALGRSAGWLDQLRAGREVQPTRVSPPPPIVDPAEATLADLQREYSHFMTLLNPAEMDRLYHLNEMYHQLQVRLYDQEGCERSHA
jgi:transcriptional regulator with XRE-family HTH domain